MKKFILFIALTCSLGMSAQTISPLNSEHGKKAKGEFYLTNNGFTPLAVTVEVKGLSVRDGRVTIGDLPATTHVKMSEWSARIPAKATWTFWYDAKCDTLPCATVIFTSMMSGHTDSGVAIASHLGTVVYACEKPKGCRASILKDVKPETKAGE
jgi:hypothetical protein